ncbi:hypothetical protein OAL47_02970 [Verrucomicrobia bacterium]|nr:hypothetical protein [Verrucomicrobiota bacterium]
MRVWHVDKLCQTSVVGPAQTQQTLCSQQRLSDTDIVNVEWTLAALPADYFHAFVQNVMSRLSGPWLRYFDTQSWDHLTDESHSSGNA